MLRHRLIGNVIRFRRFSRKGFSAFASMHRVVTVGRLAVYITDLQLRKSGRVFLLSLPVLQPLREDDDIGEDENISPTLCLLVARQAAGFSLAVADADCVRTHPHIIYKRRPLSTEGGLLFFCLPAPENAAKKVFRTSKTSHPH